MPEQAFSTVIRGGTAVLPEGIARADIGIRGETIAAIGQNLGTGEREIDATGRVVAPGGVDPDGAGEILRRPLAGRFGAASLDLHV